jgi:hypothetical protein
MLIMTAWTPTATQNPDQVQFLNCETITDALAELQEKGVFGELEGPYP